MGRNAASYKKLLEALLPRGKAWSRESGSMPELLEGIAQELSRVDGQVDSLVAERDSQYSSALLPEHELDLDIAPEAGATDTERRIAIRAILTAMGGQNPAYFITLAEGMGYTITIDEFRPAWCGVVTAGEPCGNQEVIFVWRVNLQYSDEYEDPYGTDLYAVLLRLKPAHTELIFRIAGPEYSRAYSRAFDAMPGLTDEQLEGGAYSHREYSSAYDVRYGGSYEYGAFSDAYDKVK